jgi:hypothetical protein
MNVPDYRKTDLTSKSPDPLRVALELIANTGMDARQCMETATRALSESPAGDKYLPDDGSAATQDFKSENSGLRAEIDSLQWRLANVTRELETRQAHDKGDVWYWQGDGSDNLSSMGNGMAVVIRADQLHALTPGSQVPQPDQRVVEALRLLRDEMSKVFQGLGTGGEVKAVLSATKILAQIDAESASIDRATQNDSTSSGKELYEQDVSARMDRSGRAPQDYLRWEQLEAVEQSNWNSRAIAGVSTQHGYKLLSREPVESMVHAAQDLPEPRMFGPVWRAMWDAAPSQPGPLGLDARRVALNDAANVCRSAAEAYERRGQHSGIGWQVAVYLERGIRALDVPA